MTDTPLADDPSQWTNIGTERNIPRSKGESSPAAPALRFTGHTQEDYHALRLALHMIAQNSNSTRSRQQAADALSITPKDGSSV